MGNKLSKKSKELELKLIKVKELLEKRDIDIPYYQRPYKWSVRNVTQLIDDILFHKNKSAYRLGTIVFFQDKIKKEIVDGQQRTITLILIHLAIWNKENKNLAKELEQNKYKLPNCDLFNSLFFNNDISRNNIRESYNEIKRRLVDFDLETISFFYENCELVSITLKDISEAFQFFDSQNSRGRDLVPHDLLKAFHLREMSHTSEEAERIKKVENWEELESKELKVLFANYLSRIKNWSNGNSSRRFTKKEVGLFKGISPKVTESYPFAALYRISNVYVDAYNDNSDRLVDSHKMEYPFQLDHPVINGKRFFELVDHYLKVKHHIDVAIKKNEKANAVYEIIQNYPGRHRTGDKYVRNLFDCCLIYYWDKFGEVQIEKIVEKAFIWAYALRLKQYSVQLATADNYALANPRLFQKIKNALHPSDVVNVRLNSLEKNKLVRDIKMIREKFEELNYCH